MYEDEYGIPLKLNHELKTMKEAEDYFKRLDKYVGDYKLNYYIGVITLDLSMFKDKDEKEIYKKLFDKLEKERLT